MNLYADVGNDPLNFIDPFGLSPDSPSTTWASANRVARFWHGRKYSLWRGNRCRSGHRSGRKRYPTGDLAPRSLCTKPGKHHFIVRGQSNKSKQKARPHRPGF
jgi:hypothetical protein